MREAEGAEVDKISNVQDYCVAAALQDCSTGTIKSQGGKDWSYVSKSWWR